MTFTISGPPATKGSTVSFLGKDGRVVTKTDSKGLASWTQAVGWAARAAGVTLEPRDRGVRVEASFISTRPQSAKRRPLPVVRPDVDKMTRALLDALTGVAYVDDAQVVDLVVYKRYGGADETVVTVGPTYLEVENG